MDKIAEKYPASFNRKDKHFLRKRRKNIYKFEWSFGPIDVDLEVSGGVHEY